ncbi:12189_t:CDS:2 [Cetraspora pellucida]|uniref:12189_t:CDS:1 n=1 Tax=Cetraspora pellucida TaxID=1433469 RepID=A0A9N9BF82_9GLOM|nr:12189_t:CDS:2 [Cetraspora pellucida]
MDSQFDYHGNSTKLSNADVMIQVGEEPDMMTFLAHSDVLRKKSPYFRTALSSTWAKKEGENIILKKPNISPTLSHHDGSVILDILVAADELLIENDLLSYIQNHLIHDKSKWLQNHFALVLHTVFEQDACKELRIYCMDKICWDPNVVFKSPEFLDFDSSILIHILKQDNLQIEETEIWDHLIRWGIAQSSPSDPDMSRWSKDDFLNLQEILKDLIPLIRFSEISHEYYDKIFPFRDILPLTLKNDLITFLDSKCHPNSILLPRCPIISINSSIISPQQALKIPEWIDQVQKNYYVPFSRLQSFLFSFGNRGNIDDAKLSKIQPGNEAIYDDPSFGPCFGKTDLDMRRQFNEKNNCSAKKRCYKHNIINYTKFSVDDYEVFQVFCHLVSSK